MSRKAVATVKRGFQVAAQMAAAMLQKQQPQEGVDEEFSSDEQDEFEEAEGETGDEAMSEGEDEDDLDGLDEYSDLEEGHKKVRLFDGEDEEEDEELDGLDESDDLDESDLDLDLEESNENDLNESDDLDLDETESIATAHETEDLDTVPPAVLRERIQKHALILADWKTQAPIAFPNGEQSRAQLLAAWQRDLAAYYGYSPFMVEKLSGSGLFGIREAIEFFEANEAPRPVTLRINTLKTRKRDLLQALTSRGVNAQSLSWNDTAVQVFESPVPIGATPEYMAGHYLLQATSSLLPVMALAPQPGQRVLDMSAAPGGKTTHIAALLRNTGVVFANDASRSRLKALVANCHRLGVRNAIVCCHDGRQLPRVMSGFDRVLLDAPCSGTGVISKDASVKTSKTEQDFASLTHRQKELVLAAADATADRGGILVYSTCSVVVEENEEIVAYLLAKRPQFKLVDTGLPFGRPGFTAYQGKHFHHSLTLTRRFYPHAHNMDGFFVAKFIRQ